MASRQDIEDTLDALRAYRFSKTVDEISTFSENADIYYYHLGNTDYIVINHFCKKKKIRFQGFDCWKCQYTNKEQIGINDPITIEEIKLGFLYDKDRHLIQSYLQ